MVKIMLKVLLPCLVYTGCHAEAETVKVIPLNQDIIKIFKSEEWNKTGKYASDFLNVFTNKDGNYIISSLDEEREDSYLILVKENTIELRKYYFQKGLKEKSVISPTETVNELYSWEEIGKHYYMHEFASSGTKINDKLVAIAITSNDMGEPGLGIGYLGIYDGKRLKRIFLRYKGYTLSFDEVESGYDYFLYYDKEYNSLFFPAFFTNRNVPKELKGYHILRYSLETGKFTIAYTDPKGVIICAIWRIPGTDYLIFWNDGVVMSRMK